MTTRRPALSSRKRTPRVAAAPVVIKLSLPHPGAGDPRYALDNLEDAIRILATHPGSLRERLCQALYHLAPVAARDIPESLRAEFEALRRETTKNPSRMQPAIRDGRLVQEHSGTIAATVGYMQTKRLVRIAERLHELCARLQAELEDERG